MLRFKILTAIILLTITEGDCQKVQNEKTKIHKMAIKSLQKEGGKFTVNPTAKKVYFMGFDFASGGRGLDTSSAKPLLSARLVHIT